MTYAGTVRNGKIVLDETVDLDEGARVLVATSPSTDPLLEEASLDDAIGKLTLLYKIHRGLDQAAAGETVSHREARERLFTRHAC